MIDGRGAKFGAFIFLALALFNVYFFNQSLILFKQGEKAEGIVTYTYRGSEWNGRRVTRDTIPVVTYFAKDGKMYTTKACAGCYEVGEKVPVIFDPNEPSHVEVDSNNRYMSLYYALVFGAGAIFCILRMRVIKGEYKPRS